MAVTRLDGTFLGTGAELTFGENAATGGSVATWTVRSDVSFTTGLLFFEFLYTNTPGLLKAVGVLDSTVAATASLVDGGVGRWGYRENGNKNSVATGNVAYGASWGHGDIISVAWDVANGNVWFAKNGTWQAGATDGEIAAGTTTNAAFTDTDTAGTTPWRPAATLSMANANYFGSGVIANFGQFGPSMAIPSGYAFPDVIEEYSPGVEAIPGNGWERFDWVNGGFTLGAASFEPSPANLVDADGRTVRSIVGNNDSSSTLISKLVSRTSANLLGSTKYYWEVEVVTPPASGQNGEVGFSEDGGVNMSEPNAPTTDVPLPGPTEEGLAVDIVDGDITGVNNAAIGNLGVPVATDVIMFAVDTGAGEAWVGLNGTWFGGGDPATATSPTDTFTDPGDLRAMARLDGFTPAASPDTGVIKLNSISADYAHTPPSGFGDLPAAPAPKNADGVLDISIGITAAGSNPNRRGDGVLDISIATSPGSAGSNPNRRANGNLGGLFFLITADGTNTSRHGDGVQNITIALAGTGTNFTIHGDGAPGGMNIQLAGAGVSTNITGSSVLPALATSGQMNQGPIYFGDARLPRLRVEGLLDNPQGGFGNPRLPQLQTEGTLQGPNDVTLPSLATDATGFAGSLATGVALLPLLQTTGVLDNPLFATGVPRLPGLRVVGVGVSGAALSNTVILPGLQVVAAGSGENVITGNLTLPFIRLDPASGVAAAGSIGGNSVILPALLVEGLLVNASVLTTTAWSMNTETFKTTNYINFDFVDLVSFGGQPYGVTAAGIFLLEGADDDGTDIDARFLTGIEDLNNENMKELSRIYMEYVASGAIRVNIWPDGQTRVRNYDIERVSNTTTTGIKHARFKGARGLRSRSFQLGAQNLSGGDFDIDKLGILLRILSRKTRKH